MDISKIKIDSAKIEAGEWVKEIPGMGDLELRVRGLGSIAYREALAARQRAIPRDKRNADGSIPVRLSDEATAAAIADAILLDWRNLESGEVSVAFAPDLARDYLIDPDYGVFLDAVLFAASKVASDAAVVEKALEKN